MAKTLMDLLEPEIKESNIRAAVEASKRYVSEEVAIRDVAEEYGVTVEVVKVILEKNEPVPV